MRKPFARVHYTGGRSRDFSSETEAGKNLFIAASRVNDVGRAARRASRGLAPEPDPEVAPDTSPEGTL